MARHPKKPWRYRFALAELLDETAVSQRKLSLETGLSPTILNRMALNKSRAASLETLATLAEALSRHAGREITPNDLIEREK